MLLIARTFTCKAIGSSWFRRLIPSLKIPSANRNIRCACGKSFTDDLVASGYCKRESKLCLTIRWGFCRVLRFVLPDFAIIIWLSPALRCDFDRLWSALRCPLLFRQRFADSVSPLMIGGFEYLNLSILSKFFQINCSQALSYGISSVFSTDQDFRKIGRMDGFSETLIWWKSRKSAKRWNAEVWGIFGIGQRNAENI